MKYKSEDEAVKLLAETLKEGMSKFIGERNTEQSAQIMKEHMISTLRTFMHLDMLEAPIPEVRVNIHGNTASFTFLDPRTRDEIDLATWMSRAHEGYYD